MQASNCAGVARRAPQQPHRAGASRPSSRHALGALPLAPAAPRRPCGAHVDAGARVTHLTAAGAAGRRRRLRAAAAYGPQGASYDPSAYPSVAASQPPQFGGGRTGVGASTSSSSGTSSSATALAPADAGGSALKAKEQPKTLPVRFWLKFHVDYGQSIRIIGGHDAMGAWNLRKAPFLRWSEGDLWNVNIELAAGGVYEYKYVVVEADGTTAASWQRGANNVLALQLSDEDVEVYDNWKNTPGALVLCDGQEITRERKLLSWASDMAVQRSELRRTRMELAQAREEIRVLRAELSVLRMEVSEANIARAAAEARQVELERQNSALRLEVASSQASARTTMEEAVRLLTDMEGDDGEPSSSGGSGDVYAAAHPSSSSSSSGGGGGGPQSSYAPASAASSNGAASGGGNGVFGGLFGFTMPGSGGGNGNGRVQSHSPGADQAAAGSGPGSAASAVVAAAAAMAAAADPWRHAAQGAGGQHQQGPGARGSTGAAAAAARPRGRRPRPEAAAAGGDGQRMPAGHAHASTLAWWARPAL